MPSQEKTQILFNSPALHALKRDQLIKLCKSHSIKASGKSVDLIERLKEHARSLPAGSSSDTALWDDEDGQNVDGDSGREENEEGDETVKPSERWDVIMDDIQVVMADTETDSSTGGGTLSSLRSRTLGSTNSRGGRGGGGGGTPGEFGTSNSKCQSYYIITPPNIIETLFVRC